MRISVIIPTYNRKEVLANLLDFLLHERHSSVDVEIIVSDDRSKDGTAEMVSSVYPQVRLTTGPGLGAEQNKRVAIEAATGDFLVFLDDDCMPHEGWITNVIPAIERGEKLVQSKLVFLDLGQQELQDESGEHFITGYRWDLMPLGIINGGYRPQYINSCFEAALFIAREVLERVPFDDPNLISDYGAAASFFHRAKVAGYRVFFEPSSVVDHLGANAGGGKDREAKKFPKRDCDEYTTRMIHNLVVLGRMTKTKRLPLVIGYYLVGSIYLSLRQKKNCLKYFYRGIVSGLKQEFRPVVPYRNL